MPFVHDDQVDLPTDRIHVTNFAPPMICLIAATDRIANDALRQSGCVDAECAMTANDYIQRKPSYESDINEDKLSWLLFRTIQSYAEIETTVVEKKSKQ